MATREREAIVRALTEYCSLAGQDFGDFELRDPIELPNAPVWSFKLRRLTENCTRVLVLSFHQGRNATDPDWTDFDECVMRIKNAIREFWDGACMKTKDEVDVRY